MVIKITLVNNEEFNFRVEQHLLDRIGSNDFEDIVDYLFNRSFYIISNRQRAIPKNKILYVDLVSE